MKPGFRVGETFASGSRRPTLGLTKPPGRESPDVSYLGTMALCSAFRTLDLPWPHHPHREAVTFWASGGVEGISVCNHVGRHRQLIHRNGVGLADFLLDDPNGLPAYEEELAHLLQRPATSSQRQDRVVSREAVAEVVVRFGHAASLAHILAVVKWEPETCHKAT